MRRTCCGSTRRTPLLPAPDRAHVPPPSLMEAAPRRRPMGCHVAPVVVSSDTTARAAMHERAVPVVRSAPAQLCATHLHSPLGARTGVHGRARHAGYRSLCPRPRPAQRFTAAAAGLACRRSQGPEQRSSPATPEEGRSPGAGRRPQEMPRVDKRETPRVRPIPSRHGCRADWHFFTPVLRGTFNWGGIAALDGVRRRFGSVSSRAARRGQMADRRAGLGRSASRFT